MTETGADRPAAPREGASRPEVQLHIERAREALAGDVREIKARLAPIVAGISVAVAAVSLAATILTIRTVRRRRRRRLL